MKELIPMKKILSIIAAIPLLFACNLESNPSGSEGQEPEKNNPKEQIVTAEASEIGYDSATLSGYATIPEGMTGATFGVIVSKDENPTVLNGTIFESDELGSSYGFRSYAPRYSGLSVRPVSE